MADPRGVPRTDDVLRAPAPANLAAHPDDAHPDDVSRAVEVARRG